MAQQGMAVINVGTGMCYGGRVEEFDQSLPCIGSLRCNPNRCHQAVITRAECKISSFKISPPLPHTHQL